jgi:hypothetical protein
MVVKAIGRANKGIFQKSFPVVRSISRKDFLLFWGGIKEYRQVDILTSF